MQCPSCGFENIPGREQCAICSTVLTSRARVGNVMPPRAKNRTIGQRIKYATRAEDVQGRAMLFLDILRNSFADRQPVVEPEWWHVILCIIPGVGHWLALGKLALGAAQLLVALLAMLVVVYLPGSLEGQIAVSIVMSLSVLSVFIYVDKHWGSSEPGANGWIRRIGLLFVILVCYQILNYCVGYFFSLLRILYIILGMHH